MIFDKEVVPYLFFTSSELIVITVGCLYNLIKEFSAIKSFFPQYICQPGLLRLIEVLAGVSIVTLRRRSQIQILLASLNSYGRGADTYPHLAHIFSAYTHTKTIAGVLPRVHKRSHVSTCSLPAVSWDIMLPNHHIHHSKCSYSMSQAKAGEQDISILSASRTEYCSVSEYSATVEFLSACGNRPTFSMHYTMLTRMLLSPRMCMVLSLP